MKRIKSLWKRDKGSTNDDNRASVQVDNIPTASAWQKDDSDGDDMEHSAGSREASSRRPVAAGRQTSKRPQRAQQTPSGVEAEEAAAAAEAEAAWLADNFRIAAMGEQLKKDVKRKPVGRHGGQRAPGPKVRQLSHIRKCLAFLVRF